MDPIFNYIGIGTSYHEKYEACTVIILAEDIISLGTLNEIFSCSWYKWKVQETQGIEDWGIDNC